MSRTNFLSFVEEFIFDPKYTDYTAGRIEVHPEDSDTGYATEEIRYFTDKRDEFSRFRDQFDYETVSDEALADIRRIVAERFYEEPK